MTSQIDEILSNMQFGAPRNNLNGMGRNAPITLKNQEFHLTTPPCTAPFGITRRQNKDGSETVSLALRPLQPDSNHLLFLSKLDEKIVKWAHANQEAVFGVKNKPLEVISDRFYKSIKQSNKDYPAFFEGKMKFKDGTPTFKLTDAENNEIENIEKNSTVTAVISYPSLWISSSGFGLNAKLVKAVVQPPVNQNIASYAIVDEM